MFIKTGPQGPGSFRVIQPCSKEKSRTFHCLESHLLNTHSGELAERGWHVAPGRPGTSASERALLGRGGRGHPAAAAEAGRRRGGCDRPGVARWLPCRLRCGCRGEPRRAVTTGWPRHVRARSRGWTGRRSGVARPKPASARPPWHVPVTGLAPRTGRVSQGSQVVPTAARCLWPGRQGSQWDRPRTERGELPTGTDAQAAAVVTCRRGRRPERSAVSGGRRGPAARGLRALGICGRAGLNSKKTHRPSLL